MSASILRQSCTSFLAIWCLAVSSGLHGVEVTLMTECRVAFATGC